jgi:hypothetical protein
MLTHRQRKFLERVIDINPWRDNYKLHIQLILRDGCYDYDDMRKLNSLNKFYMKHRGSYIIVEEQIGNTGRTLPIFSKEKSNLWSKYV